MLLLALLVGNMVTILLPEKLIFTKSISHDKSIACCSQHHAMRFLCSPKQQQHIEARKKTAGCFCDR